jgi:hypothetical protein
MLSVVVPTLAARAATAGDARSDEATRAQVFIDELSGRLGLDATVTATMVSQNRWLVSVEAASTPAAFVMSFQADFVVGLSDEELEAIVAHELGHVWIFTHHPYLQTERLANDVALRVVSRESLTRVYDKVWAAGGAKGDLARFLPDPQ